MSKIFISSLDRGYDATIAEAFAFLGQRAAVSSSDTVCLKPNLTFPTFREGVMTNPAAVESVVRYLSDFTRKIVICEADSGGYNPFSMDDVFRSTGLTEIARRYGARLVNLSREPSRPIRVRARLRKLEVPLPLLILDEADLFITMPVPKVHMNTGVSISIKNQWGIIQQPALRLKLHPYFADVIYAVNKALPRAIAVVDGKYGLTRSGPMRGDPVNLNWLLAGDDLFVTDRVVCELMGIDPLRIRYLRRALKREGVTPLDRVEANCRYASFARDRFTLERHWTDLPGLMTFNSRALAYIGYESVLAKSLHKLLYKFREPFY